MQSTEPRGTRTVGLLNPSSTRSLGNGAIYSAIGQLSPDGQVLALLGDAEASRIPRLRPARDLARCDVLVAVDDETHHDLERPQHAGAHDDTLQHLTSRPARTFAFGHSLRGAALQGAPFEHALKALGTLSSVVVRDRDSAERLIERGVAAELGYDPAFVLQPTLAFEAAAGLAFARAGLVAERTALIAVRDLDRDGVAPAASFAARVATLAVALRARGHQPALLIQTDLGPDRGDRAIAARVAVLLPDIPVIDCFATAGGVVGWPLLSGLLARARLVVAGRYHTAVLRLGAGRKPFILHAADDADDLAERLGLPQAAARSFDPDAIISELEMTAEQAFDPAPLRRDIEDRFAACVAAASA